MLRDFLFEQRTESHPGSHPFLFRYCLLVNVERYPRVGVAEQLLCGLDVYPF